MTMQRKCQILTLIKYFKGYLIFILANHSENRYTACFQESFHIVPVIAMPVFLSVLTEMKPIVTWDRTTELPHLCHFGLPRRSKDWCKKSVKIWTKI